MIKTDSTVDGLGTRDYVFSCHNRSFAVTRSPLLPKPTETIIDLELAEFLDIPIKKIEARKFSFAGTDTRIVGRISQTVQCVVNGKTSGTIHLKASVVRHLTKFSNMDCVAGGQLHKRLAGTPDNITQDLYRADTIATPEHKKKTLNDSKDSTTSKSPKRTPKHSTPSSPTTSIISSPGTPLYSSLYEAWLYQNGHEDRFDVENDRPVDKRWMYDEDYEMWGLPYNFTGPLAIPDSKDNMVTFIIDKEDNMVPYMDVDKQGWPDIKQTFPPTLPNPPILSNPTPRHSNAQSSHNHPPTRPIPILPENLTSNQPNPKASESIEGKSSPQPEPTPTQPPVPLLHNLVFCGRHQPCPCLPGLSQHQATFLPLHCPLYLPQVHTPCGLHCGCHHVHQPPPGPCHCAPPKIGQYLEPPDWFWEMFPSHSFPLPHMSRPSIQQVSIPQPNDTATLEMCSNCDDYNCRCEDLYFRLQREQQDIAYE